MGIRLGAPPPPSSAQREGLLNTLPQQRDIETAAGWPNGLCKHPIMERIPTDLQCACAFNLVVPGEFIAAYRTYVDTKVLPNRDIPKEARELLWCLGQSTARRITQVREYDESVEMDDDPDAENGSDHLTEEEADKLYLHRVNEPFVIRNELSGVYALKTTWTLGELGIAGPFLPNYVTLNGRRIAWETRAMALQSVALAGAPTSLHQHLANVLVDEEYRGLTPLVDPPGEPGEPIEVEMREQTGILPEFALLASLEATHYDSLSAYTELSAVGTRFAETNNPVRPSTWRQLLAWLKPKALAFFRPFSYWG